MRAEGIRVCRVVRLAVCAALLARGLTGCSKRPAAAPPKPERPAAQTQATKPRGKAVRVALVMPGLITDMSWNTGAHKALIEAAKETGATFSFQQGVADADVERALRDYAQKGYDLILAESFNYGDAVLKVAKEFPDTRFATATHFKTSRNVAFYDWPAHHAGYLAGMLAGLRTQSMKVGFVGGYEVPDIIRIAEAYKLGAKAVNPKVAVKVLYTQSWEETVKGTECAKTLLDWGADVIAQGADGPGVGAMKAAAERGAWAIGYVADQRHIAPERVLTSIVLSKKVAYVAMIHDIQNGTFKGKGYLFDMLAGGVQTAPYAHVTPEVAARLEQARKDIMAGKLKVPNIEKSTH